MKTTIKLFLLVLISITLQNCDKDDFDSPNNNNPDLNTNDQVFQSEHFGSATTGNFMGLITDENGEKLENVQISIGNSITNTDRNGLFILNNVNVFENFAYIRASKDGYINGSRVVIPKTDGVNRINIVLLEKVVTATVNSGESSIVTLDSGVSVGFGGDFITSNGYPYSGQVEVVLHYLDLNDTTTFEKTPGSFFAQTASNDAMSLGAYGMLSVNLFSPSGEALNIYKNTPSTVTFPINSNQVALAPETIQLWHFDETVGYWKEDGQAIKSNNKYFGLVSHFSWWSYNIPADNANLCLTISSTTTSESTPYQVSITRSSSNQLVTYGHIQSNEEVCFLMPLDEDLTVSIYSTGSECYQALVHQQTLGSFSNDSTINIPFSGEFETTNITGTVTSCFGTPLNNGYVYIDDDNIFGVTNGIINFGIEHCIEELITIQIFDLDANQWKIINNVNLNVETVDLGALSTCDDTGGIYNGNVTLESQTEVNDFGAFNYTSISGNLKITGNDIVDLTPLDGLVYVNNSLGIYNNDSLQTLNGLHNLETINNALYINDNPVLTTITGLDNLSSIGFRLTIYGNQNLESIGLNAITSISENVYIENNDSLITLDGLNNIASFVVLMLFDNDNLNSIGGLSNLSTLERLWVKDNNSLINFEGLEQLTELNSLWVGSNPALTSLDGLESVITMTPSSGFSNILIGFGLNFDVFDNLPNPNLTDFCALENLFVNGNGSSLNSQQFVIMNNGYNPTIQDLVDGNCSQ